MANDTRTVTAVTITIVNTVCLAWLGYIFFVTAVFYDMALLVTYDPAQALLFYTIPEGRFLSLPEIFLLITGLAIIVTFLGVCIYLPGSKAKIRQLILLCTISSIVYSYTFMIHYLEDRVYLSAQSKYEYYEKLQSQDFFEKQELKRLSNTIEKYRAK